MLFVLPHRDHQYSTCRLATTASKTTFGSIRAANPYHPSTTPSIADQRDSHHVLSQLHKFLRGLTYHRRHHSEKLSAKVFGLANRRPAGRFVQDSSPLTRIQHR